MWKNYTLVKTNKTPQNIIWYDLIKIYGTLIILYTVQNIFSSTFLINNSLQESKERITEHNLLTVSLTVELFEWKKRKHGFKFNEKNNTKNFTRKLKFIMRKTNLGQKATAGMHRPSLDPDP